MANTFRGILRDLNGKSGANVRARSATLAGSGSEGDAEDGGEKKPGLVITKSE